MLTLRTLPRFENKGMHMTYLLNLSAVRGCRKKVKLSLQRSLTVKFNRYLPLTLLASPVVANSWYEMARSRSISHFISGGKSVTHRGELKFIQAASCTRPLPRFLATGSPTPAATKQVVAEQPQEAPSPDLGQLFSSCCRPPTQN